MSHFLANPALFARNANRGAGEGGDDGNGENDEDAICVAMDVKRMKASANGSLHDQEEEEEDDDDDSSSRTAGKAKKGRRGKKGKNARSSSASTGDQLDGNDEQQQQGAQLRVSLSQSLAILQAVIDDSISQSASYAPDLLARTLSVLQPLLSSLQHYAFPLSSSSSSSPSPSPAVMDMYFRLISLRIRIEIFQSVTHSLAANAKMMETRLRASEKGEDKNSGVNESMTIPSDVKNNPLVGKVPSTLVELRELLSKQLLTIDDLGM